MAEVKSSSTDKKVKKPSEVEVLTERLDKLEGALAMMAHYSGSNRVLTEHDIPLWVPSQKHKSRRTS